MSEPRTFLDGRIVLHQGDCLNVMRTLPDNSIDACVTDPPYALVSIVKRFGKTSQSDNTQTSDRSRKGADGHARFSKGFMGKDWDNGSTVFAVDFWTEVLRVLKPGAHVVAFGGTRSYHRLALAIEDAGFEIRDQIRFDHESDGETTAFLDSLGDEQRAQFFKLFGERGPGMLGWLYGSGFPKSHDVAKGIDAHFFHRWLDDDPARRAAYRAEVKAAMAIEARWRALGGFAPEVVEVGAAVKRMIPGAGQAADGWAKDDGAAYQPLTTRAATPQGRAWEGWGTAIKPAQEPICVARKPLAEKTVAANVLANGTGAINVAACRVETVDDLNGGAYAANGGRASLAGDNSVTIKWGEVELRVDKALVDCYRKSWQEAKSILTQAQIFEQREFALSAINRHIGETYRARPRKAKMERLMFELVSWHIMQEDAS